ncbi:hypothetical protein Tco_1407440 [Tanacetum coccineum]
MAPPSSPNTSPALSPITTPGISPSKLLLTLMRSSYDFYKKFYNTLGRAPNRCSSSIGKNRGVVIVHLRNRLGRLDHGLTKF